MLAGESQAWLATLFPECEDNVFSSSKLSTFASTSLNVILLQHRTAESVDLDMTLGICCISRVIHKCDTFWEHYCRSRISKMLLSWLIQLCYNLRQVYQKTPRPPEVKKMPDNQPGDNQILDLLVESTSKRRLDRPKKLQSLIDTQAMRFLETMDFNSFNDLSGTIEKFMMDAPLFQANSSFSSAAQALDLTAQLFSTIDTDKNQLISRDELAYLLQKTTAANRQALSWLIENFQAFTQACFFKDQIGKDEVEAARNVFHGLKIIQEKMGFTRPPTLDNLQELDLSEIRNYLKTNKHSLTGHEASGLKYLLDHLEKNKKTEVKNSRDTKAEKSGTKDNDVTEVQFAGVLDRRSWQTLQALNLNNFESLFQAFVDFMEDAASFQGDTPFTKAANTLDTTADVLAGLEMGEDHMFSPSELLIVSKLVSARDKKQVGWFARNFDRIARVFFSGGKAKKKEIREAAGIFNGLELVRERFNCGDEVYPEFTQQLNRHIKNYFAAQRASLPERDRDGLSGLIAFMEKHAGSS